MVEMLVGGWTKAPVVMGSRIPLTNESEVATAPFEMAVAPSEVSGWMGASVAVRSKISLTDEFKVITSFEMLVLAWTKAPAAMHVSLTSELKMVEMLVRGRTKASVVMRSRISLTNESEVATASFEMAVASFEMPVLG